MHITTRNINSAFRELVALFYRDDVADDTGIAVIRRPSRNGSVLMIDEPVTITYTRPRERVLFNAARDANPFLHVMEALWMLAGRNDVAPLAYYAGRMRDFSDDGTTLNGAYGYRWRHGRYSESDGRSVGVGWVDQLDLLVSHLRANPTSRRAVLQMWNAEDDLLKVGSSKDVCCNLSVMFSLREGVPGPLPAMQDTNRYLDMTVTNRSNDLVWGLLGANHVHFSVLQEYVAARLGAEVGRYHHFTNNLHVYDDPGNPKVAPWEPEKWLGDEEEDYYQLGGHGCGAIETVPLVRDPEAFERELPEFVETYSGPHDRCAKYSEPFLETVAKPLLEGYHLRKLGLGDQVASLMLDKVAADDWRVAATSWLKRREKNLSLVQYRVLNAIVKAGPSGLTYRGIEKKTGYYSILTAQLRPEHEGSLGNNGLVKEQVHDVNGRDILHFVATAKANKLFSK